MVPTSDECTVLTGRNHSCRQMHKNDRIRSDSHACGYIMHCTTMNDKQINVRLHQARQLESYKPTRPILNLLRLNGTYRKHHRTHLQAYVDLILHKLHTPGPLAVASKRKPDSPWSGTTVQVIHNFTHPVLYIQESPLYCLHATK